MIELMLISVMIWLVLLYFALEYSSHDEDDTFENWEEEYFDKKNVEEEEHKEMYRNSYEWSKKNLRYSLKNFGLVIGKVVYGLLHGIRKLLLKIFNKFI